MAVKKPEGLTWDELREHMARFSRVYSHKRKGEEPDHIEKVRERKRRNRRALYQSKKAAREAKKAEEEEEKG